MTFITNQLFFILYFFDNKWINKCYIKTQANSNWRTYVLTLLFICARLSERKDAFLLPRSTLKTE